MSDIRIKTPEQIEGIRKACRLASDVLDMIGDYVKVGVTTLELDNIMNDYIVKHGAISACFGYGDPGFPRYTCISLNHVVCHGIPNDKALKKGDILNIDVTVILDGYYGDNSRMYKAGEISTLAQRLIDTTYESMMLGIEVVKPGAEFREIGRVIQKHAHANHFSVVEDFCGHGVGVEFHEAPLVLHYDSPKVTDIMQEGMIFTIEPMLNVGKHACKVLSDNWTVVTRDRSLSAQWEHQILVTATGYEILTLSNK